MKRKIRFSYYVVVLFFCCIILYNFFCGVYDGICDTAQLDDVQVQDGMEVEEQGEGVHREDRDDIVDLIIRIGVSLVCVRLLYRKLKYPIDAMTESMDKVAGGDLESRVAMPAFAEFQQMGDSFNAMADALKQAEAEKIQREKNNHQLYSNIAHDLKSPMTMVWGYAKALERGDVPKEKQQSYLETICQQTEHVNQLLDLLLTYTRLENETYQLQLEQADMAEVLRSCLAAHYGAFEEHGASLEISIPEKSSMYSFDVLEMKRVFHNLLSNMVRHTEYGTACKVSLVEMTTEENGKKIQISFADEGKRLNERVKENLFSPFCVGDESRNTKGGSGLGLSIAKKVIERHGGRIVYEEDKEGKGKAFVITLP